jgi:hypothetical protein
MLFPDMLNFCTLFDSNYLSRGLVMYDSLLKSGCNFHLYVFAFNEDCLNTLKQLSPERMTVISLASFEDEELLRVKPLRSRAEYCWTCTSSTIQYVLDRFGVENCTYIDADLYFYGNPGVLIREAEDSGKSVMITSHRYTRRYDQSFLRGKYCVQFMYFKNDPQGREVLKWWRERCLEWCYARVEDGKFGDQKYLDDWTLRFSSVHEMQHSGGGIAPWNCQQYDFYKDSGILKGRCRKTGINFPVVFFHFHGVKLFTGKKAVYAPRSYTLERKVKEYFYRPYTELLWQKGKELSLLFPGIDFHGLGNVSRYRREKWLTGHYSWLKRNILNRIFPPRTA